MRQRGTVRTLLGSAFGNYLPQQLISATEVGSLFAAEAPQRGEMCLLRVLSVPPSVADSELEEHLARFLRATTQIQQIQHPYLLPLIDAGVVGDVPYLVWPLIAMHPLALTDGPVAPIDAQTAGRYLDEIAAALEYVHERGVIHGNLALEGIYEQRDGRLLLGDLGVRQLVELLRQDMQWHYLYTLTDPCTPEQTLGRRPRGATDVYLLACALFRLLTGQQIFYGVTREDVAHAHLHEPVPPLSAFRPDLPPDLDALLAAALDKDPAHRIQRPGALANAFHDIVAPYDTTRIPFAIEDAAPPAAGTPQAPMMTRPLTYGPYSPFADGGTPPLSPNNGGRITAMPRVTGAPYTPYASYAPPLGSPPDAGAAGAGSYPFPDLPHPSLPPPSPRFTQPPMPSGPAPTSRPLVTGGPAPASRPLVTSRPMNPSRPFAQTGGPAPDTIYVRPHPASQPLVPPRWTGGPALSTATGPVPPLRLTAAPARSQGGRGPTHRALKFALLALIIVLLITALGLALRSFASTGPASGQVMFADNPQGPLGVTNSLTISAAALTVPPQGSHYVAWLVNSHTQQVLSLGALVAAEDGTSYRLAYQAAAAQVNVLSAGDTIEITLEAAVGQVPKGRVVLEGSFPPRSFVYVGHLLAADPVTPNAVGIMVGTVRQAADVDAQAKALFTASVASDQVGVRCYAQNVVNIIEGSKGGDFAALPAACDTLKIAPVGDGYGLLSSSRQVQTGYLDEATLQATLAATQADATPALQQHAQRLQVAVGNAQTWLRGALTAALALLASPASQAQARQLQLLANQAYHGTDANGDGHIDAVQGEAGIAIAYSEAQQMATMTLSAPK
jgi:serine/threonine protein kinase